MRCFHPHTISAPYSMFNYPYGRAEFFRVIRFTHRVPKHNILVPCGKCPACLRSRQLAWAFRAECEADSRPVLPLFITLTYAPSFLPVDGSLSKSDLSLFLKRLRTYFTRYLISQGFDPENDFEKHLFRLKFLACGEYGSRYGRPHYHLCLFSDCVVPYSLVEKAWNNIRSGFRGRVDIKPFLPSRGAYVAKYSMKQIGFDYGDLESPFLHVSNGLGLSFIEKYGSTIRVLGTFSIANSSGRVIPLPRYFKERIYTPEQIVSHSFEVFVREYDRDLRDPSRLSSLRDQERNFIRVAEERLAAARLVSVL